MMGVPVCVFIYRLLFLRENRPDMSRKRNFLRFNGKISSYSIYCFYYDIHDSRLLPEITVLCNYPGVSV